MEHELTQKHNTLNKSKQRAITNTYSREEGLHVLIGVCYRRQIHQISVQHLLIPVKI